MNNRIVVTGLGMVSSIGIGKDIFWDNLIKGESGISEITAFDTSKLDRHLGGEVKNFEPADFISIKRAQIIGRTSQFAIAASRLALEDAKLEQKSLSGLKTSVCLGSTMGEIQALEKADHSWIKSGKDEKYIASLDVYKSLVNNISANVAVEFKLRGRNRMFTTACAAGNYAIGYGYDLLLAKQADLVIAGGADVFSWIVFTGFSKLGIIAPEKCQPFDKNRKGVIPGEGSGIIILETLASALKRNVPIYAEILGYGLSCGANHMTNSCLEGVVECMRSALENTGILNNDVDYINAHGTGTINNDMTECLAINRIFNNRKVAVSSVKSMLGHTMGAASAIEAIACCLAIKNDIIPSTINYETPDPVCDIDCVPNMARKQKVNIAINNGFAFGGNNACLVLKKYKDC